MSILQEINQTVANTRAIMVLSFSLALCGVLMLSGCVEEDVGGEEEVTTLALQVTPRVQLDGLDELATDVFLQDLFLGIGEIRLEPMDPGRAEIVYVTRSPMFMHFDLATGEHMLEGLPIGLPHGGEYLISIRLEPMDSGELEAESLRLDGLLAHPTEEPEAQDEPMPLPWLTQNDNGVRLPEGVAEKPVKWVPWTYSSARSTVLVLNSVEFTGEQEQTLVIALDLLQWLDSALEPIHAAVQDRTEQHPDLVTSTENITPIDVSDKVEDDGARVENLNAWSEVKARPRE